MTEATGTTVPTSSKVGVFSLTALVVGSMIGGGVYSLPGRFASQTGVVGSVIAWAVACTGMLMLALVFQFLAVARPKLDSGLYAYAKHGFGDYVGFLSAIGYWASLCASLVTFWILITSTLGLAFPAFGEGDTVPSLLLGSAGLWLCDLLVRRGVGKAADLNRFVTVAKVLPVIVFIVLVLFAFDPEVFRANLLAGGDAAPFPEQVRATMLSTVFVFLGVEAASVFSRHARRREDVGRATVLGFVGVAAVFASVTIVSYGVLPREEIAALPQPSMAGVLASAVGPWAGVFVSVALCVSVLGAYLALVLTASETLYAAAADGDMPRFLAKVSRRDVPTRGLALTSVFVQILLVVALFAQNTLDFAIEGTATLALIPFFLVAAYALMVLLDRRARMPRQGRLLAVAVIATAYAVGLVFAAGFTQLLLSCVVFAPATVLFAMTRREQHRRTFTPFEWAVFGVVVVAAVAVVVGLAAGWLTL
ncbi:basic amino acid/polyamine antiporter [Tessaracoccus palaemonis]|uniref:Basic amino acid/polyamine antiporter n=1 Tax=Tessaracoccus palaemonis TaxID=2829499 RepID=A0ABX8SL68_9ACTN|nr:basic amino acid/polyamine antiporter [Tessaracoccus palaemonis]QXT63165.1 basic amino acid/polyamine antiporter [Tessaracoccus palaemonis]